MRVRFPDEGAVKRRCARYWVGNTVRIDYRRDLVALSFPVACINTPRWVAARVLEVSKKSAGVFDSDDLPDQNRTVGTYSPRVHQG